MANDDHRQEPVPDWDSWVEAQLADSEAAALRGHRRDGRARLRRRVLTALGATVMLGVIGSAYWLTAGHHPAGTATAAAPKPSGSASASGSAPASAAPSPRIEVEGVLPSNAPSILPSLLAKPVIDPRTVFPDQSVTGTAGAKYQQVALQSTTDCSLAVSEKFAEILRQPGNDCLRATGALFVDEKQASRVTVMVLSFRQVQGMSAAFGMASIDPVSYQTISVDPPVGSPVPPGDPTAGGVFKRLGTVRSVVFVTGQWADAKNTDEAGLTTQVDDLLGYAADKVVAYEQQL